MGAVDLVVQVESPRSVSAGLQRIGRAGHQVGEPSRGKIFPKHRADLVEAAVVVQRMRRGAHRVDPLPAQPARRAGPADRGDGRARRVEGRRAGRARAAGGQLRRADRRGARAPCSTCSSGRYPSDEFAELRPRIVWDRVDGVVRGRAGAQRLAVTSGGTIPDRGLFGVFLPDGTRVGELDEEMVYESRPGETFLLGASTWRIEDITHDRVIVTPAPGQPGKMPFWHGDGPGRPLELGRAVGEFVRDGPHAAGRRALAERLRARPRARRAGGRQPGRSTSTSRPRRRARCPTTARSSSSGSATRSATGGCACSSPFGAQVHAPWAMALQARLGERWGIDVELMWSDDGIVLRLPEAVDELPLDELLIDPDEVDELVDRAAAGHRAVRVAVPRVRGPGPAAAPAPARPAHAAVAAAPAGRRPARRGQPQYPTFPILLETTRECLNDVFDLPALREVLARPARRQGAGRAPSTRRGRRRSPSRCCSAGSPSTCTRATRRWPSGGPPPSPSTATCCASCSAPRSCASCSTPTCSPTSSSSSSAWSTAAGPATPTSSTTCCAGSAR